MSRPTDISEYNKAWLEMSDSSYSIKDPDRLDPILQSGSPDDMIKPHFISFHENGIYATVGVGKNNHSIVGAFEMDTEPEKPSWHDLSVSAHARNRMSQRSITTGDMREIFTDFLWWDRLAYRLYKIVSVVDGENYFAIINIGNNEIKTVWKNHRNTYHD
jgi:hypothetical protein